MQERATFFSDGVQLVGTMWIPDDYRKGDKWPILVDFHGLTADYRLAGIQEGASRFWNEAGYIVLAFNFRGYGESGGEPRRVTMMQEVIDVSNAITYVQHRPEVDPERIVLEGWSLGGGVAAYAAAVDQRVKATISHWGAGDGYAWLKSLWRLSEWRKLLKELDEDIEQRVVYGKPSKMVPLEHIAHVEGREYEFEKEWEKKGLFGGMVPLSYFESILNFKPMEVVDRISPRPIFFQHPIVETFVEYNQSIMLYDKAKEPKKLWLIKPSEVASHFDVYNGREGGPGFFNTVMQVSIDWLKQYVPPRA